MAQWARMIILLFEDSRVDALRPITLTRAACLISCAGFTLVEAIQFLRPDADIAVLPRPELRGTTPGFNATLKGEAIFLNARLVPRLTTLQKLLDTAQPLPVSDLHEAESLIANGELSPSPDAELLTFPWDVVRYNLLYAKENLEALAKTGYTEIQPGVFAHASAVIEKFVSFNTESGPILLDEGVVVKNFVAMNGPIRVRKDSTILEHSVIVGPTTIGETCKIRGEVMESIFESHSNKQHYGHIGHAYVGSWVNIGAGTANSDLKNTYGAVKVTMREGQRIDTDMQFLGCLLGDHAKTSINTTIMTGIIIGVGAHCAGTIRTNIPSFASTYNDTIEEIPRALSEKIMKRMMARRNVEMTKADLDLLQHVYSETAGERTSS